MAKLREMLSEQTNPKDDEGFNPVSGMRLEKSAIAEALALIRNEAGYSPHKHEYLMKEAAGTDDFPYILGYVVDRQLLAAYKLVPPAWRIFTKVLTNTNFNNREIDRTYGLDDRLEEIGKLGEYKEGKLSEAQQTLKVKKYGRKFSISFEALINDGLGAFADISTRFSNAAIRTEHYLVTSTYAASTGPNTNLYGATITDCGQAITNLGSLALTIKNLETTIGLMQSQKDPNGETISVVPRFLVVPPKLELTARSILTSTMKMWTYGGDDEAAAVPMPMTNVLPQTGLQLVVDDYLPIVDTTHGDTTWYLFADDPEHPSLFAAYLRGHETPEVCMKASDKLTFGGGAGGVLSGDFDTDKIQYRVRDIFGTVAGDPRFTYAQAATS